MKPEIEQSVLEAITLNPLSMRKAADFAEMPYRTFIERAKKLNIYNPNQSGKGTKKPNTGNSSRIPLEEILDGKHPQYQTNHLRKRLLVEGLMENKCSECGIEEWNGKQIVNELDHIDGISDNHLKENLRLLCPNCHSQTDTFRGKNIKKK
jgi:hypothetical protein